MSEEITPEVIEEIILRSDWSSFCSVRPENGNSCGERVRVIGEAIIMFLRSFKWVLMDRFRFMNEERFKIR